MSRTAATPTVRLRKTEFDGQYETTDGRFLVLRRDYANTLGEPSRAFSEWVATDARTDESKTTRTLREAREWIDAILAEEERGRITEANARFREAQRQGNLHAIGERIGHELARAAAEGVCPRCGGLDVALWGETEERTENDVTDYAECPCGFYAESTDPEFLAIKRGPIGWPQDLALFRATMAGLASLESREDAEAWLRGASSDIGPGFHPDTCGEEYVAADGSAVFTFSEAMLFDALRQEVFTFDGLDPYAVVVNSVYSAAMRPDLAGHYQRPCFPDGAVDGCEEFVDEVVLRDDEERRVGLGVPEFGWSAPPWPRPVPDGWGVEHQTPLTADEERAVARLEREALAAASPRPEPKVAYVIRHRGEEIASAETFRGALTALATLRDEVEEPSALVAYSRRESAVAGIGPDGRSVQTYQGSETWA